MTGTAALHPAPMGQAAWVQHLRDREIPVLARTADELESWREREDDADAHQLAEFIAADPLMTLKVLATLGRHRPASLVTDPESVTAALLVLGIGPFFRHFGPQPVVEDQLDAHPGSARALRAMLERARRAARFALGFAVHRLEPDTELIHQAALLHDTAELLVACATPERWHAMQAALAADPSRRSAEVQQQHFGVDFISLQQSLFAMWRLPARLLAMLDDHHAHTSRVRCVTLAVRLARHLGTDTGWHNAALPDDVAEVAAHLNINPGATLKLLRDLDE
jgi:HD-like signal output (HDOD) protein